MAGYEGDRGADALLLPDKSELKTWRVVAAFVFAPFFAALAFAFYEPAYDGLASYSERVLRSAIIYAVVGALLPTVVLGIPAFLVLRKFLQATALNCVIAGAVIAAIPWAILGLRPSADSASIGGRATVINGEYTAYGWQEFGQFLMIIGAAGALGGLFFWLIAAAKLPRKTG